MFLPGLGSRASLQLQSTRRYDDRARAGACPRQIAAHPQIFSRCMPFFSGAPPVLAKHPSSWEEPWHELVTFGVALLTCFSIAGMINCIVLAEFLASSLQCYWWGTMPDLKHDLVCLVQGHACEVNWVDKVQGLRSFTPMTCRDWQTPTFFKAGEKGIDKCINVWCFHGIRKIPQIICSERAICWKRGQYTGCSALKDVKDFERFSLLCLISWLLALNFGCFSPVKPEESQHAALSRSTRLTCELLKGHNEDASHPL